MLSVSGINSMSISSLFFILLIFLFNDNELLIRIDLGIIDTLGILDLV